jgi:dipeptidyl aminopeptidase/acylaminoacyl peptidase
MGSRIILESWSPYLRWSGWSPDGRKCTCASSAQPEVVGVLDVERGVIARLAGHQEGVNAAVWSPQGGVIATASWDGTVRLWGETGEMLRAIELVPEGSVEGVSWSPEGEQLAAVCSDGSVHILSSRTGKVVREWQFEGGVFCAAWHPQGQSVMVTGEHGWSRIELAAGGVAHGRWGYPAIEGAWQAEGQVAAVTCEDGTVWLDQANEKPRLFLSLSAAGRGVNWHPSGLLAVGDGGGEIRVFDGLGAEVWNKHLSGEVVAVRWRPGSHDLLVATRGYEARLEELGKLSAD